jgi:transcription elongation factor Elf1
MKICPYCEQDSVWKVILKTNQKFAFKMCFECDSVWRTNDLISDSTGSNFEALMNETNQPIDWTNIDRLGLAE